MQPVICYQCPNCSEEYSPDDLDGIMRTPSGHDVATLIRCEECGFIAMAAWTVKLWTAMNAAHMRWRQWEATQREEQANVLSHMASSEIGRVVADFRRNELDDVEAVVQEWSDLA